MLIVITGFVIPAEEITFSHLEDLFDNVLVRLVVFGVAFLTFMYSANRFRHTMVDMGLKSLFTPISVLSYLAAIAGPVWPAVVVLG